MGYDTNRFIDLHPLIEEELCCNICCGIFQKPVITPCGHTFCKDCLNTWFNYEKTCPCCRKIVDKTCPPPIIIKNILARLKIKCNYHERGCLAVMALESIDKHESICNFRSQTGFFKNLWKNILPVFTNMLTRSLSRTTSEYDVDVANDEDDEVHLMDANIDNGQIFPYFLQAATIAGLLYNCYNLLNFS